MTTEKIMVGKIIAKLRNTVPVCLMENGKETKRYKNIEFPDELKTTDASAFGFVITADGKIEFHLCFDEGVLPEEFPANRKSVTWAERAAAKAVNTEEPAQAAAEVTGAVTDGAVTVTVSEAVESAEPVQLAITEARFGVTGERRKELVAAVSEILDAKKRYEGVSTQAFVIGNCRIDKNGTLTGEITPMLIEALEERGFTAISGTVA
jgi:hypothetical protein